MTLSEIVTAVAGVGGLSAVGLLLRTRAQNRKDGASTVEIVDGVAGRQVERLEAEVNRVSERAKAAESQVSALGVEVASARGQIRELLDELTEYRRRYGPLRPSQS